METSRGGNTIGSTSTPLGDGVAGRVDRDGSKPAGRWFWSQVGATILLHLLLPGGHAEAVGHVAWTTGPQFQQRLAQPVDALWSGSALRDAMVSLSQTQQVAILMDRRVDPGQKLDLAIKGVPMETALQTIADRCGLAVSRLGSVVYLGPPSAAALLEPSAAAFEKAVERLPKAVQRKFSSPKALAWEDLSTPRDLLAELGKQNGLKLVGLERVPHDLWAAADLPPLSLADRLTLIAFQYDLTFAISSGGSTLEIEPIANDLEPLPEKRQGESPLHSVPKPSAADRAANIERIRIQRMAVQAEPLGRVLHQLADRLGLELRIDEKALQEADISLDQPVTAKVENATVDELLRELLRSTGLKFRRQKNVVEIVPAG